MSSPKIVAPLDADGFVPAVGKKCGDFNVSHGDRVSFVRGNKLSHGKVNGLLVFPSHLVLDMGGPHGRPCVVHADEIRYVKSAKKGAP